jgi:hypothetical protein
MQGKLVTDWKLAHFVPVSKVSSASVHVPDQFRPISLSQDKPAGFIYFKPAGFIYFFFTRPKTHCASGGRSVNLELILMRPVLSKQVGADDHFRSESSLANFQTRDSVSICEKATYVSFSI